jgi:PIN domain nuclease of toxin-antitoxin system
MRLLIDTQILLWALMDDARLTAEARKLIVEADEVFVSAASIWEIAIKAAINKLDADPDEVVGAVAASGFKELPVTAAHAAGVAKLPHHHRDPFDRLLVSQALCEPLRLLTHDVQLEQYSELVMLV